jgi:hypothetical protein
MSYIVTVMFATSTVTLCAVGVITPLSDSGAKCNVGLKMQTF